MERRQATPRLSRSRLFRLSHRGPRADTLPSCLVSSYPSPWTRTALSTGYRTEQEAFEMQKCKETLTNHPRQGTMLVYPTSAQILQSICLSTLPVVSGEPETNSYYDLLSRKKGSPHSASSGRSQATWALGDGRPDSLPVSPLCRSLPNRLL